MLKYRQGNQDKFKLSVYHHKRLPPLVAGYGKNTTTRYRTSLRYTHVYYNVILSELQLFYVHAGQSYLSPVIIYNGV